MLSSAIFGPPVALASTNAPCSTAWVWRARLSAVKSKRAAARRHRRGDVGLERRGVAEHLGAQASRIAGWVA